MPVHYWSAKQVISLKETQAVLFSKYDHNYLVEQNLTDNKTWKINWFGRHADVAFLNQLGCLRETNKTLLTGASLDRGYELTSSKKHSFSALFT